MTKIRVLQVDVVAFIWEKNTKIVRKVTTYVLLLKGSNFKKISIKQDIMECINNDVKK